MRRSQTATPGPILPAVMDAKLSVDVAVHPRDRMGILCASACRCSRRTEAVHPVLCPEDCRLSRRPSAARPPSGATASRGSCYSQLCWRGLDPCAVAVGWRLATAFDRRQLASTTHAARRAPCNNDDLRSALRGRLDIDVSFSAAGFGVDQGGDCRMAAQLVQAAAASRPDALDRDAQPGADLGVRHWRVLD